MSLDELLTRLNDTRAAHDDASEKLSETIKWTQKFRDGLFQTREPWVGWEATAVIDRLMTARHHTMGVAQELKACARVAERNLAEADGADEPDKPDNADKVGTLSSAHLFARMAVGLGVALFGVVVLVTEALGKHWFSERVWDVAFGVVVLFYPVSYALGTARERRLTLVGLAGTGAFFVSLSVTSQITGWSSDNWRAGVVAAGVLLVVGAAVYAVRRRSR